MPFDFAQGTCTDERSEGSRAQNKPGKKHGQSLIPASVHSVDGDQGIMQIRADS